MSILITGAAVIDAVADRPRDGWAILIEGRRIKAVGPTGEIAAPPGTTTINAAGKFAIPGLMNANVHLLVDVRLENLARYMGRYEDLIAEAAQIALKHGQTTVFDTWGPRRHLMAVRDKIASSAIPGARMFCAGNIVGLDGPYSDDFDFFAKGMASASTTFMRRVNATWVENVGRHLMWLTPEMVGHELRGYIGKGIDFVKYASNDHTPGAFLAFSERQQRAIVDEAHRAGITAQSHTMSVEGLRIAVEAGCDLIQHANNTGPIPVPDTTIEEMVKRNTGTVVFPYTREKREWHKKNASYVSFKGPTEWDVTDINTRKFIAAGLPLMLANDGALMAPEAMADKTYADVLGEDHERDNLFSLASGHFYWFRAMEEAGCPPMTMLRAATRNIAAAYGKSQDLGTLEVGKLADVLLLDKNPLDNAENYRAIHTIIKDGAVVDRSALPVTPLLTKPLDPPTAEEGDYVTFLSGGKFPGCGCC